MTESSVNAAPESPSAVLARAALHVEERAARAIAGPWREDEPIDCQPSVIGPAGEWVAECGPRPGITAPNGKGDADAAWIAMMSPDLAVPIAALFRHHAGAARWASTVGEVDRSSGVIDLALQILGEDT